MEVLLYLSTMLNKSINNMKHIIEKMREIAELESQIREKKKEIEILMKKEENK